MSRHKRRRFVLAGLVIASAAAGVFLFAIRPSNTRDWMTDYSRLPEAGFDGDSVHITGIRNFGYTATGTVSPDYYDATYDLAALESVWFVLAVFNPDESRALAHSMLSFGFTDGRYLVVSIEARKEAGESFSFVRGAFKKFELTYVIGDERDLILTRAVHREDDVYVYPVKTTPEKARRLFVDMLETANRLRDKPEFYNTITNNCTTRLRDHANNIVPGRIPPSWKILLTGYTDELIQELGLLEDGLTLEEARARYRVNDRAQAAVNDTRFSERIRN